MSEEPVVPRRTSRPPSMYGSSTAAAHHEPGTASPSGDASSGAAVAEADLIRALQQTTEALKRLQELHTQLRQTSEALVEHVDKTSFATPQDLAKLQARATGTASETAAELEAAQAALAAEQVLSALQATPRRRTHSFAARPLALTRSGSGNDTDGSGTEDDRSSRHRVRAAAAAANRAAHASAVASSKPLSTSYAILPLVSPATLTTQLYVPSASRVDCLLPQVRQQLRQAKRNDPSAPA